jgi:SAM-dependent methyltransferase
MSAADSIHNQPRLYDDLALIWPIISPPEDYIEEAEEFHMLIKEHSLIETRSLLHLGCGGGHLDFTLKQFYRVTGVDQSEAMLNLAKALNPDQEYLQGDMRLLDLDRTFDAVIAADSIDYMLDPTDLRAAFVTAFNHLRPGGVFCTYAEETLSLFQQNKTRATTHTQGEITITTLENYFDPDSTDTTYEMTFVHLIRKEGDLSVEIDRHTAGLFSAAVWIEQLEEAGFNVKMVEYQDAGPTFIGLKPQTPSN